MKLKLLLLFIPVLTYSCKNKETFKQTKDGLEYRFIKKNDKNAKPEVGYALVLNMKIFHNDSIIFDSREVSTSYRIMLEAPKVDGSIYEGFAMLHKGDSAIFRIDAINFYKYTATTQAPDVIKKGDKLTFYVKLIDF